MLIDLVALLSFLYYKSFSYVKNKLIILINKK